MVRQHLLQRQFVLEASNGFYGKKKTDLFTWTLASVTSMCSASVCVNRSIFGILLLLASRKIDVVGDAVAPFEWTFMVVRFTKEN